ncbi:MAG: lamin tail domain-containing protein [Chitinophagaceae bacterium]
MKKTYTLILLLCAFSAKSQVVINEVYGGGGNSGATYKNDFIELYNNSSAAVSLTGWSVQYASSTGTTWQVTVLSGSIPANGHYLVQEAAGAGGTTNLPTPDATGSIAMSGTAGKVILCNATTAQTGANPVGTQIIDKVGYGAGTNGFEGAGPTATLTNTTSAQRNPEGFDSNNNNTDFATSPPSPANASGGADVTPPSIPTLLPSNNATNVSTSFPAAITFSKSIQKGAAGTITIKKLADNSIIQTINTTNATVIVSGSSVTFDVNSLAFNTTYYVEISNGAFKDLSNNNFAGITGNTTWRFTTSATPPAGILGATYSFSTCSAGLPDGFSQYNVLGDQKWGCTTFGRDAANLPSGSAPNGVQINGFLVTNIPNEDWLITPSFNLTGTAFPLLSFWSRTAFNGAPLQLKTSTDYPGTGDPRNYTWTDLNGRFPNQTSDVWTLSGNINLSPFKQSSVFIAFVYTSSGDDGARWTLDDIKIENSATPPPPALSVNSTDMQFTFVASGSTADKTFTFIGNDLTADVTLTSTGTYLLSKDGTTFSSSITYSVAEANNISKNVFVRFAPTQSNQDYTGTVTIATSPLSAIVNLKGTSIDPATTLEVVNWNVEWFGSTSFGPTNDNLQEQNAKTILQNIGADIYGLVEVVDEARLARVVSQMPGYSYIIGNYGSHVNPPAPTGGPVSEAQKEAFVYKTSMFSNVTTRPLINNQNISSTSYNNWASGRYPFLMTADVTLNCVTKKINFVLIHAKANTSPTATSYARRQASANELHDTLITYFPNDNIIIFGDFNDDLDRSITAGFTTTSYSSFTTDNANFFSPTLALSLAGKKSTVSYNDVIDHVLLSNELQPFYLPSTANILTDVASLVSNYGKTTTDHYPVFTRYQFKNTTPPVIASCPTIPAFCANNNNTYTIPAITATDDCEIVNYSYTITGATQRSGSSNNASGIYNAGTSTITWTVTDDFANAATCQTTVTVNSNPVVTIPDAYAITSGVLLNTVYLGYSPAASITLIANVSGGSPAYSYNWSNGSISSSTTVSPTANTTYNLTVTDANGCKASASKNIDVKDIRGTKNNKNITICHKTKQETNTIEVNQNAVHAHLAHGDFLGTCTAPNILTLLRITASPNPATSYFIITAEGGDVSEKIRVTVSNVMGKVIYQEDNLFTKSFRLGANYLPGLYFIQAIQGNQKASLVLVKPGP